MHPSTHQGATNTGAPRNTRNGNGQPGDSQNRTSRSTNYTDADGALASQSEFISQSADTSWSFSQSSVPQAGENISYQQPQSVSSSSMIGPPSAFYNAEDVTQHHVDNSQQYQQWVDAYGSQHQQTAYSTQPNYNQGVSQSSGPLPDHYALVRGQYAAPRNQGQFGESLVGAMGQPSTSANVDTRYRQQQQAPASQPNSNLYDYISQGGSVGGNSGSTLTFQQYRPQQETEQQPRPIRQMRQAQQFQVPRQNPSQAQLQVPPPRGQRQVQPQQRERDSQAQQGQTQSQSRSPFSTGELAQSYSSELLPVGGAKPQSRSSGQSVSPSSWDDLVFSSRGSSAEAPIPTTGVAASSSSTSRLAQAGASTSKRPMPAKSSPQHSPPTKATGPPDRQGGNRASKRKRPKKNPDAGFVSEGLVEISDSESDDDAVFGSGMVSISVGTGGLGVEGSGRVQRPPGACRHCKKLKMKCDFPPDANTCKRCRAGGHPCIVEGRKQRTAPNKREYLLAQIKQKDAIIESLLKQLHNPYIATPLSIASYRMATSPSDTTNSNVLAWLDRLQASVSTAGGKVGPNAFKLDTRGIQDIAEEEESEDEDPATVGVISPSEDEDADDEEEIDPMRSALPDSHVPLGLIANLSLSNKKSKGKGKKDPKGDALDDNLDDDDVGVANETYFMPGPATDLGIRATLIEQHSPPEILVHGLVTPEDVDKLFEIFYTRVNPFISLLDPVLHTPANTFARCPFLFTVVCAISSRYYPQKSEIYPIAMHFAKHSAANALIDGWKSVELCQAYILMSVYAVPARRWEEDRSWLYTGLAIRIATDLNLHQASPLSKATSEKQEREILNRTRVWMICYNLDRSTATQFGKPSTIKDDYIVRNAKDWYKKSSYAHTFDIHLCGYSALLRIVAKFHDEIFSDPSTPSGLNRRLDFRAVTMAHDAHLNAYNEEWSRRFAQDSDPNDRAAVFRCNLLPFLVEYSRLVMFSFGFQQAFQRGLQPGDHVFFNKCLDAAKAVIRQMIEVLAPSGYMRYAPDGHFIFASFASAFLLKLLRPEFSNLLSKEHENEIFDLIGRLIQTLSSSEIAIDDRHTPKLYARFLAGLLSKHRRDGATAGRLHPHPPPSRQAPQTVSSTPQGGQSSSALSRDNAPMTTTFSINPPRSSGSGGQRRDANTAGGSAYTNSNAMTGVQFDSPASSATFVASPGQDTTPVYTSEVTFAAGVGPIHLGSDFDFGVITDEEMLATMQIIKNPAFWDTMMMPGFSMDPQSPMSNGNTPSPYNPSAPPFASGFGPMHSVQAHLH